ncbi:MAG TPA: cation diffusion facilitator family transporter [Thermotogota bacterium]|nr:cation diffusion facilitator family transporter [Thermotogota bacterium]HPJ88368.1 cation diffusion facilitator family transporter [Thermotogota bacterium]
MNRIQNIKRASWIGVIGNTILAVLKIFTGAVTGSFAVIGDGIDSTTDILTSFLTLWVTKIIDKPPDEEHPYGHGRAETIATGILAFIIFYAGIQLIITSIQRIFSGEVSQIPSAPAIYVTIFSIIVKIFLAWYKYSTGKREKSSMLIADAKNMRNDVFLSSSVLIGLIFTYVFNLPILDKIVALFLGVWIIKVAIEIFYEENHELMEGVEDTSVYNQIFHAVGIVEGAYNPHKARIRKIGAYLIIDLDIEVDGQMTVTASHEIARQVEKSIKEHVEHVYDVLIHVEPLGNVEEDEKYGVCSKRHK